MLNNHNTSVRADPPTDVVQLRDVGTADLPHFYAHQCDPQASQMADFPVREQPAFMAHWANILANPAVRAQTIVFNQQVAGNIGSFDEQGQRMVGYWIDRQYWGRGIATRALALFLDQEPIRPLYAYVALHNVGSRRVLEKCGFRLIETQETELLLCLE